MTDGWSKYTLTAARSHAPMSRPTSGTIDIHSHIIVPAAAELVSAPYPVRTNDGLSADTVAVGRKQLADRRPHICAILPSACPTLTPWVSNARSSSHLLNNVTTRDPVDIAVKAARLVNDGMAEFAARRPDRFIPFGSVPMPELTAAVSELEYCVHKLGFKGVQILTNVAGRELSDPAFEPFWAKADELKVAGCYPSSRLHRAAQTSPASTSTTS